MSLISYKLGQGSIILRVKIRNSSVSTGAGLTGLTSASSGLIISTIADNESSATAYTVAGSTIESITTLGTYAAPTATKCRFKEVDATNHKGVYEIQIADARFAVSNAKSMMVSISGATNAAETDAIIPLSSVDPYDGTAYGVSRIDASISSRSTYAGGDTSGTTTLLTRLPSALTIVNGKVDAIAISRSGTAQAGASTTLTLDSGASAVDNYYVGLGLVWTSGANIGVVRVITGYVGSTKVATFARALPSAADATPTFIITDITHNLPGTDGKALISTDSQDISSTLSVNAKNIAGVAAAVDANNFLKVDVEDVRGSTVNSLVSGRVDSSVGAMATDVLTSAALAASASTEIASAVCDESLTGHTTGGTLGKTISDINSKTTNLPGSPAAVGSAMTLDLTQAVPTSNTAQTVGDALNAARAQGFGKWTIVGTTLNLYASDGSTVVRSFTLDSGSAPTSRT